MPRCFPEEPDFSADRAAERTVWEHLRDQLPDDAALFHSVNLLERDREHEIDLLVAWPGVGLAAIEVKGGHVRRDAQGWTQESAGTRRKIRPVVQAQDGRHVLQRYLDKHTSSAGDARAMHLVAVPFTAVPAQWVAPDLDRACLLGRGDLDDVADRVRRAVEQHGQGHRPLTAQEGDAVVRVLAAELGSQTSLLSDAEEHEQRVDQMTRDQAHVLASFKYHRRLKVVGGAGTGKTWLALEQARRLAKAGEKVGLVCYSRGLARWFERNTLAWPSRERPAYVGLFHDLPVRWGAEPGRDDHSEDFEERLPRELGELAAQQPASELFDSVVVDEAQDFGAQWWPSLVACLREAEQGGLFVFMDEARRVFARAGEAPIDLPPYVLDENIRNTKNIANLFSSLSGEALRARSMTGPPVRLVECAEDDAVSRADDAVCALLDEGFEPGQVALLTTLHRHPEQRSQVEMGGHAAYWDAFFAADDVFYSNVLGFKGLERPVIVLAVNGFREAQRAREQLYVGLSRARTLLVVVGQRSVLEQVGGGGVRKRLGKAQRWDPPSQAED